MSEVIDWDQFDAVMGDGSDGMSELFGEFLLDIHNKFEELEKNAASGNLARIAWDAHQMKGSAGSFGLLAFVEEVAALEAQAKSGDQAHLTPAIDRLRTLFSEGVEVIQSERAFLAKYPI